MKYFGRINKINNQVTLADRCQASHYDGLLTDLRLQRWNKVNVGSHSKHCWIFNRRIVQYVAECWAIDDKFRNIIKNIHNDDCEDDDEEDEINSKESTNKNEFEASPRISNNGKFANSCQASHGDGLLTDLRLQRWNKVNIRSHSTNCWIFSRWTVQYVTYCWAMDDEFGNVENDHAKDEDETHIDDSEPLTFSSDPRQNNFKLLTGPQTLTNPGKNDFEDVTKDHTPAPSRNFKHHKSSVKNTLFDCKISGR